VGSVQDENDTHGSAVAVYEYESDSKIPTYDDLKLCCEDDAFNGKPTAWRA